MSQQIILVTGPRRTGTTLLNAILCADRQANPVIGEAAMICKLMEILKWAADPYRFAAFGQHVFEDEKDLTACFGEMVESYVRRVSLRYGEPRFIVLKSPEFCLVADALLAAIPQAKFVVSVRDPRDQIVSELEVRIRGEDGTLDPSGVQLGQVPGLIRKFRSYCDPLLAAASRAPARFKFVRYEDMIASFDDTLAGLQAFTGMTENTFDPAGDWPRYVATDDFIPNYPSYSPFYGRPLEPSRAGRYLNVLRPGDIELIETECGAFMSRFGYGKAVLPNNGLESEVAPTSKN